MILSARIHCHEFLEGGYGVEGATRIARALEDSGVDTLNITGGGHRTSLPQLTAQTPPGAFAHLARSIADAVAIPTMFAATVYDLAKNYRWLEPGDLLWLALAFVLSFLVAWASVRWLLRAMLPALRVLISAPMRLKRSNHAGKLQGGLLASVLAIF